MGGLRVQRSRDPLGIIFEEGPAQRVILSRVYDLVLWDGETLVCSRLPDDIPRRPTHALFPFRPIASAASF